MDLFNLGLTERETLGLVVALSVLFLFFLAIHWIVTAHYVKAASGPREKSFVVKTSFAIVLWLVLYIGALIAMPSPYSDIMNIVMISVSVFGGVVHDRIKARIKAEESVE